MDALSEALNTVRMTGAIFFNAEFTAPWGFAEPYAHKIAHVLAPGIERLVPYHLVTEGEAVARIEGAPDLSLTAGDIVIVPHGDPHRLFRGSPARLLDGGAWLENVFSGDLSVTRCGGGGAATRFICGYFGCERHADRLFLAGLPSLFKVSIRSDAAGRWLESSIQHLVSEAECKRPGGTVLLSKMAEALFIETLRRYMEQLPPEQTGWLAGARDPVVGGALAALHRNPHHRWTVENLAAEIGASRSSLNDRFTRFLGESPLAYLVRWRLQLAARLLQTTQKTVMQLALDVGYESEAAFNRAFKREFGLPPAQYRRKLAGSDRPAGPCSSPNVG
ncbi:AraC-like DNA-binding protein [Bradyrhizobium sp. AZCC 1719]|uniref:AraC family transcriptional regulator n=1 Tax=Bradyrhizobium sp. AZCC 1719 TaxID=3117028 RepID=UPI002FF25618